MRPEWREYWMESIKAMRSVFLALGVSLVLWLFQLPGMAKADYLSSLLIACMYGLVIFAYIWVLYAIAWAIVTHFKLNNHKLITPNWTFHLTLSLSGMMAGILTSKWLKSLILGIPFSTSGLLESIMLGCFIALMFMFYYSYKHSSEENSELKAAKAESELHVLKNQMQPHFLFNSLNSLSELIDSNRESAAEMTLKLSDLYREILENSKQQFATLESEVSIIKKYLELESLRFGDRLGYEIKVPESSNQIMIPPLVMQTLVENAVKHGISPLVDGGKVIVSVSGAKPHGYMMRISNTVETRPSKRKGSGTGLANTKARLDLLYGDKHKFSTHNLPNQVETSFWFSGEPLHA